MTLRMTKMGRSMKTVLIFKGGFDFKSVRLSDIKNKGIGHGV